MVIGKVIVGGTKGAVKASKKVGKVIFHNKTIDEQVEEALKMRDVRKAYKEYKGKPEDFVSGLKEYINQENEKNSRLYQVAKYIDGINKATLPIDAGLSYFTIMGGVGMGARAIKTAAMLPLYLADGAYYLGKTGDLFGTAKKIGYEGLSWAIPGSAPHLIPYHQNKAKEYAVKKGSKQFLKKLKASPLERKVIPINKKSKELEDIFKEAA